MDDYRKFVEREFCKLELSGVVAPTPVSEQAVLPKH